MPALFDPAFNIQFKCDKDIDEVVSTFKSKFESMMIHWQGFLGQNDDYYFDFHRDLGYQFGLSPYTYELYIAGKGGEWEDLNKQKAMKDFVRSVINYFQEQDCILHFTTLFPLDDEHNKS